MNIFAKSRIISVELDSELVDIERLMVRRKVGHIPVLSENVLKGIISDSDIKRHKSRLAGTDLSNQREEATLKLKAHQIMTRDLITINLSQPVEDAVDLILKHDIHCLLIVDDDEQLKGIVTYSDLLRFMKKILKRIKVEEDLSLQE
ncbi:MAG: CBS domain-containing protein [Lentisphaeria bacterium]|nr:CBS domain-containing protein [Lentisphaeria bacterium]